MAELGTKDSSIHSFSFATDMYLGFVRFTDVKTPDHQASGGRYLVSSLYTWLALAQEISAYRSAPLCSL